MKTFVSLAFAGLLFSAPVAQAREYVVPKLHVSQILPAPRTALQYERATGFFGRWQDGEIVSTYERIHRGQWVDANKRGGLRTCFAIHEAADYGIPCKRFGITLLR